MTLSWSSVLENTSTLSSTAELTAPSSQLLLEGSYARSGPDLVITGPEGTVWTVEDYFTLLPPPALTGPGGEVLSGTVVSLLAGQGMAVQVAEAGDGLRGWHQVAQAIEPIGTVAEHQGTVWVTRNGQRIELAAGDPVYMGDVVETEGGSAIGIVFIDETEFSLGPSGRMVLDDLVYDPASGSGSASFTLVSGAFSFVSGQLAKAGPDAMQVNTPVATIGIRGTSGTIEVVDENGVVLLRAVLLPDPTGTVGELLVTTLDGQVMTLNVPFNGLNFQPGQPLQTFTTTQQEIQERYGSVIQFLRSEIQGISGPSSSQPNGGPGQPAAPEGQDNGNTPGNGNGEGNGGDSDSSDAGDNGNTPQEAAVTPSPTPAAPRIIAPPAPANTGLAGGDGPGTSGGLVGAGGGAAGGLSTILLSQPTLPQLPTTTPPRSTVTTETTPPPTVTLPSETVFTLSTAFVLDNASHLFLTGPWTTGILDTSAISDFYHYIFSLTRGTGSAANNLILTFHNGATITISNHFSTGQLQWVREDTGDVRLAKGYTEEVAGADHLFFGPGAGQTATVVGGSGDAFLIWMGGSGSFTGGVNWDDPEVSKGVSFLNSSEGVYVNLDTDGYGAGIAGALDFDLDDEPMLAPDSSWSLTLSQVTEVDGSFYGDYLKGNQHNNHFMGLGGGDIIDGGSSSSFDTVDYGWSRHGITLYMDVGMDMGQPWTVSTQSLMDENIVSTDYLYNINGIIGSDFDDTFYLSLDLLEDVLYQDYAMSLMAGAGYDTLVLTGLGTMTLDLTDSHMVGTSTDHGLLRGFERIAVDEADVGIVLTAEVVRALSDTNTLHIYGTDNVMTYDYMALDDAGWTDVSTAENISNGYTVYQSGDDPEVFVWVNAAPLSI